MAVRSRLIEYDPLEALLASIATLPLPMIVTDLAAPENPIIGINDAFVALTGYRPELAIGKNCRFLAGPATEKEARTELRRAVEERRSTVVELTNYREDGHPFRNIVMIAPLRSSDGIPRFFLGALMQASTSGTLSGLRQTRARALVDSLTPRPRQVLALMAEGHRSKDIASLLGINLKTVKMHRQRMYKRLRVASAAEAIRLAVEADLLFSDPARS